MHLDFKEIGLKAGLEVHQQLECGKLFCRCKSVLREEQADFTVKRLLRPVASETWEKDLTAIEQFEKKHVFLYEGFNDTTCEVELDESPVKEIDKEALNTVLEVALLTSSKIQKKIIFMRKAVIDGSNTSAFQRTGLVAMNGKIKTREKKVGIQTIALEEDSARLVQKNGSEVVYRLDRLGIPLIELATEPELFSPLEVKECAFEIGKIFRLTGKTKRGLGTIRQDLNVSIREGERVEIKGVQDLENIDKYVEREVQRQLGLIDIKKELQKRGVEVKTLEKLSAQFLGRLSSPAGFLKGKEIAGICLPKFSGLLGKELVLGKRLGTEIADYVRAKSKAKGIMHSDEDLQKSYGMTEAEIENAKQKLEIGEKDAFVLIAGEKPQELKEILETIVVSRARQCLAGVSKETRDALPDFNTKYSRPLAGAARMYPETDLDLIEINQKELKVLQKNLPIPEKEREELYTKKFGLSQKLADQMKLSNFARFFEELAKKGFEPKKTAVFLLETLTAAKREGALTENMPREKITEMLELIFEGKITKEMEIEIIKDASAHPEKSITKILDEKMISKAPENEISETIAKIIEKNHTLVTEKGERAISALMGEAMAALKGKASGKQVSEEIKKQLSSAKK